MNTNQIRMLNGAVALREFTVADLERATGVPRKTISNTIRESSGAGAFIVDTQKTKQNLNGKRGAPAKVYALDPNRLSEAREELDRCFLAEPVDAEFDPDDARRAFEDTSAQMQLHRELTLAAAATDEVSRANRLARARRVMAAEHERLGDFEAAGYAIPRAVADGLNDLRSWITAFDLGTHQLGKGDEGWALGPFADWLTDGIENWLEGGQMGGALAEKLAPLQLIGSADQTHTEALSRQLIVVLENVERTARMPQYVCIFGLLLAMARSDSAAARLAICATLDGIGIHRVGEALQDYSTSSLGGLGRQDFLLQVLEALNKYPDLLKDRAAADWLSSLSLRQGWTYALAPFYIEQLNRVTANEHFQAIDLTLAIQDRKNDLQTVFDDTQEASLMFHGIARRVWDNMLGRLGTVQSLVDDTLRQNLPNPDTHQAFHDSFCQA